MPRRVCEGPLGAWRIRQPCPLPPLLTPPFPPPPFPAKHNLHPRGAGLSPLISSLSSCVLYVGIGQFGGDVGSPQPPLYQGQVGLESRASPGSGWKDGARARGPCIQAGGLRGRRGCAGRRWVGHLQLGQQAYMGTALRSRVSLRALARRANSLGAGGWGCHGRGPGASRPRPMRCTEQDQITGCERTWRVCPVSCGGSRVTVYMTYLCGYIALYLKERSSFYEVIKLYV